MSGQGNVKRREELLEELIVRNAVERTWLFAAAGTLIGIGVAMKAYKKCTIFAFGAAGAMVDVEVANERRIQYARQRKRT